MDQNLKPKEEITHKEVQDFYDEAFKQKDNLYDPSERTYKWVIKHLNPKSQGKLLDIACGVGLLLKNASEKGLDTVGIDLSTTALSRAKEFSPKSELHHGSGEALPFDDKSFDYVTNLGSLEHFLNPSKGVQEMVRVMKDDGGAAILVPNSFYLENVLRVLFTGKTFEDYQIIERKATRGEWTDLLESNGLQVIKTKAFKDLPRIFAPGTLKLRSFRKFWITLFLYIFTTINFADHFLFICKKK